MLSFLGSVPAAAYLQQAGGSSADAMDAGINAWEAGDFAGAVRRFRPVADQGDPDAQYNMGQAYRLGRGVPADLKIAQSWYQKAAARGHQQAQANLGLILYESGKRAEAMPWIRKAADFGDPRAQYVLGVELANGDFIQKDWPRAFALMTRSASEGVPAAAKALAQMETFMPLADRQKGIALAQQMERRPTTAVAVTLPPKAPRTAGNVPPKAPQVAGNVPPAVKTPAPAAAAPVPAVRTAAAPAAVGTGWRAQLGAYGSPAAAQAQWVNLSRKIPGLSALRPSYEQAGGFTRLRAGPLATRAAADRVCASAKAAGQACFPVAP
jgi:cell division septation protein DedD